MPGAMKAAFPGLLDCQADAARRTIDAGHRDIAACGGATTAERTPALATAAGPKREFSRFATKTKSSPVIVWLVAQGGEDVTGFHRAAEVYYARAMHRGTCCYTGAPRFRVFRVDDCGQDAGGAVFSICRFLR